MLAMYTAMGDVSSLCHNRPALLLSSLNADESFHYFVTDQFCLILVSGFYTIVLRFSPQYDRFNQSLLFASKEKYFFSQVFKLKIFLLVIFLSKFPSHSYNVENVMKFLLENILFSQLGVGSSEPSIALSPSRAINLQMP